MPDRNEIRLQENTDSETGQRENREKTEHKETGRKLLVSFLFCQVAVAFACLCLPVPACARLCLPVNELPD